MISTILALLKAVPIIDSWFQELLSAYITSRISSMKQENKDAIKAAFEGDQREIEKALGDDKAGKPSGDAGASIIDHVPGELPNNHKT
jgi:UPF0716 family protein affecting phage T7 exclusion